MRKLIRTAALVTAAALTATAFASPQALRPRDGRDAFLAAFDTHRVVALMSPVVGSFVDDLVADPRFADKADDIVVECGNALYQPVLDRYIAGDDVPIADVRKVWRDTTQPSCGFSSFYETLFAMVRRGNEKLPAAKKIRVLAGDPPVDWSTVQGPADVELDRDQHIADVVRTQVLAKNRKALLLFGLRHLVHGNVGNAVQMYEKDYPGVTYVVAYHRRFEQDNDQLEARMASWPVPSLVPFHGTWLGDLDASYFPDTEGVPPGTHGYPGVDAYLYLGRRDVLLAEQLNVRSLVDRSYLAELDRRADVLDEPADSPMRPAAVLQRAAESGVLLYE
jgi:hypothetical protein